MRYFSVVSMVVVGCKKQGKRKRGSRRTSASPTVVTDVIMHHAFVTSTQAKLALNYSISVKYPDRQLCDQQIEGPVHPLIYRSEIPKMFEAPVAHYLNRYLGEYLEGIDTKSLR